MTALPMMTDSELAQLPRDAEAGFGALETARGQLPLKAMDVQARISGLAAHIVLRQTFKNALDEPLEATYIFPLPSRGAVTTFQMAIDGRVIDGVLEERGKARRDYQEAIEAGHRAAITEEERPDVFTLRVGNLMPGEEAEVRLTLEAPLPFSDGEATFRFPLVVAPRYIPGTPLPGESVGDGVAEDTDAVPDASRITPPVLLPGFKNPVALSLSVEVDTAGLGARDLRSSLHAVVEGEAGERWRRVEVKPGERLDRDFILRFGVAEERVKTALLLCPDAEGDEGTWALTLTPPVSESHGARPRDVVFVLDRSGSMSGWKMVAARRALGRMVDTLTERDRFNVLAFDNVVVSVPEFAGEKLVAATNRNRYRAIEFLSGLDARGGTEMAKPLLQATDALAGGYQERDPVLVLVTDGQVGNEAQILAAMAPRLGRTRIFTLGVDRAVNEGFLRRLAASGGGACELVESEDRLDEVMARIHRRIDNPVLTEVRLKAVGLELVRGTQVPERVPELFAGSPLVVWGRFKGRPRGGMHLLATDAAGGKWSHEVEGTPTELATASALWARGQLRQLEDTHDLGRGGSPLVERIVETSLRFGVLCRFTAFVAIDRSEKVNVGGETHRVTQPVEAPEGWAMLGLQGPPPGAPMAATFAGKTMAVDASMLGGAPPPGSGPPAYRPQAPEQKSGIGHSLKGLGRAAAELLRGGGVREERKRRAQTRSISPAEMAAILSDGERVEGAVGDAVLLSGYRHRAERLHEALERDASADLAIRRRALGKLAVELRALLEDAASVGLAVTVLSELKTLLEALRPAVSAPDTLDAAAVDALFAEAKRVLEAFGSGGAAAPKGPSRRDSDFWK